MIYLDSNVLIYATLSIVDTPSQQEKAIEILKELINNETLLLSNLNLLKYAFKNSFDLYHVVFANAHNCQKIITFDKGFKKFRNSCDIEIEVL
ncbi:MAG: hypothetical protein K0U38_06455 [Epsilonproteobacteria bacterium]|nr:hypothetical protein [Campylobacterota bacterium]